MMPEENIGYLVDIDNPEGTAEAAREAATRAPGMDYAPAEPGDMGGQGAGTSDTAPGSLESAAEELARQLHSGAGGHDQDNPIHIPDDVTPFFPPNMDGSKQAPTDTEPAVDAVRHMMEEGTPEIATGDEIAQY